MFFPLLFIVFIINSINGERICGPNGDQTCPMRCQNEITGGILPVATKCRDIRENCGLLFNCSTEAVPCSVDSVNPVTSKIRPTFCDHPSLQDLALECAKTCMICCETPEYNCDDDQYKTIDCEANLDKCDDENWKGIMAQYCPATCGLCQYTPCTDKNTGCQSMVSLCDDENFSAYMRKNCARTCNAC